jgi:hypothetical protein
MGHRIARQRTIALLLFISCGALTAGCGGGTTGTAASVTSLTQAAYVTTLSPGYKFDMTLSTTLGEHNFRFTGAGALDEHDGRGQMSLQIKGKKITELADAPYIYLREPSGGKPWVRADLNAYSEALGANSPFGASATGPTEMLKFLKAAGQVTMVGQESIDGVPTTHYHAVIDLAHLSSAVPPSQRAGAARSAALLERVTGSSSLPMDVWIDRRDRVRRFDTTMQLCTQEGKLTESTTMDFYDFGRQTLELPPPASQTTDITKKLKAEASKGLQQLGC